MEPATPRLRKLDHLSLRVRDLERSVAFYRDVLGLRIRPAVPASLTKRRCVSPGAPGRPAFYLELTAGRPVDAVPTLDHFGIEVPSLPALHRVREAAVAFGARTTDARREQGLWRAYVFDPDGHKIEVLVRGAQVPAAAAAPRPGPLAASATAGPSPRPVRRTGSLGRLTALRVLDGRGST